MNKLHPATKLRAQLVGLLRQSVFRRLAGYEDVNASCRSAWPMDRHRARAALAEDHYARHGFEREPDLWRAGGSASEIWSDVRCGRATFTAPMVGAGCWSR